LNKSTPLLSAYFPHKTSGNAPFSISARNFSFRSISESWPHVAAIQIQQIERIKYRTATTEHKLIKNNSAFKIEAHKLTIDHGVLYLQPGEIRAQFSKTNARNPSCFNSER
jgi:hypothetical protein